MSEKTELTEREVIVVHVDQELRKSLEEQAERFQAALTGAYLAWVALGLGEIELSTLVNVRDAKRLIQERIYAANEAAFKSRALT